MRALLLSFVASALLTGSCGQRRVSPQAILSGASPADYWRKVEAMAALEREADVVLEAEGVARFQLLKPTAVAEHTAVGLDGYLRLIPTRTPSGSGLVVLIIPRFEDVQGTQKIMDEVILDVRDAAKSRGYQRFVVGTAVHGPVLQIYTDGLPSREQVVAKKREWKETAASIAKESTK